MKGRTPLTKGVRPYRTASFVEQYYKNVLDCFFDVLIEYTA